MDQKYRKYKTKYLNLKDKYYEYGVMNGAGLLPYQLSLLNNPLSNIAKDSSIINKNPFIFNHEIKNLLPITEQKNSGRCWLFATLNLIRLLAAQHWKVDKIKIDDLEFSQSYLFFWDKFERYRRSLYYFIKLKKKENNSQYLVHLYKEALSDGGQWDMAKEIVKKYGIVPKNIMPDSFHATSSNGMNQFLSDNLKQDFITLSKSNDADHIKLIEKMMEKVKELLVGFLGEPPTTFDFTFRSTDDVVIWSKLTPLKL